MLFCDVSEGGRCFGVFLPRASVAPRMAAPRGIAPNLAFEGDGRADLCSALNASGRVDAVNLACGAASDVPGLRLLARCPGLWLGAAR